MTHQPGVYVPLRAFFLVLMACENDVSKLVVSVCDAM